MKLILIFDRRTFIRRLTTEWKIAFNVMVLAMYFKIVEHL